MNVGYVRLSKDDDKRNYVSIENQKLIISQTAVEMGMALHRFYEDDGFSGYKFNRPGFQEMLESLKGDNHVIFVKDLSRIGRNNGKVLSLLDEWKEQGIRLIAIDDNYDTNSPEDDIIGIKTWYNERYVKDTSQKIKRVLAARQKEGTLPVQVPFGYSRDEKDRHVILVVREEADLIRYIFDLYLKGFGYRKISSLLTKNHIPTPSMMRHKKELEKGKIYKYPVSEKWSDGMVKNILGNDFYIGTYRLHKRERTSIHGREHRVPKPEQYAWENHHEAIIARPDFELVQELKEKRNRINYRGSRSNIPDLFSGCLFCKDCGSKLTPIVRKSRTKIREYYICNTYNTKGKNYCSKSHMIAKQDLLQDVLACLRLCRNIFADAVSAYDLKERKTEKNFFLKKKDYLTSLTANETANLKALLMQKVRDIASNPTDINIINDSYEELQCHILARINEYKKQLQELNEAEPHTFEVHDKSRNALDILDEIIADNNIDRRDIEILIDKIIIDENGCPEITLKYGLSKLISCSPTEELNRKENEIIYHAMRIIGKNKQARTPAEYLSKELAKAGIHKSPKALLPYMNLNSMLTTDRFYPQP